MNATVQKHIEAIKSGRIDRSNVIGLRKALNAFARKTNGWSTSQTAAVPSYAQVNEIERLLGELEPLVTGALHDTGLKQLQSRRYRKQLSAFSAIVENITDFRLVGFYYTGRREEYATPVYRARAANGESFLFRNVPWQSGGNGPEPVSAASSHP